MILLSAMFFALVTTSFAQEMTYEEANQQYKTDFFSYLDQESQILQALQSYEDAVKMIPDLERKIVIAERQEQQAIQSVANAESRVVAVKERIQRLQSQLEAVEASARMELDDPQDGDVLLQLDSYRQSLQSRSNNYESEIQIERRKIARVKRRPEYQFYLSQIDIHEKRVLRLTLDEKELTDQIQIIANELTRLNEQLSRYVSRRDAAMNEIPSLQSRLDEANQELEAAQASGDEFRIQIAESNFHQAHANLRRAEVQRNDAELGVTETATQIERKERLQEQKQIVLQDVVADKEQSTAELAQLQSDFTDYRVDHLQPLEQRLISLTESKGQVDEKVARIKMIENDIQMKRVEIAEQEASVPRLEEAVLAAKRRLQQAQAALQSARSNLTAGQGTVNELKTAYNQSITTAQNAYQKALASQVANQNAIQSASNSGIEVGGLQ